MKLLKTGMFLYDVLKRNIFLYIHNIVWRHIHTDTVIWLQETANDATHQQPYRAQVKKLLQKFNKISFKKDLPTGDTKKVKAIKDEMESMVVEVCRIYFYLPLMHK